MKQLYYKARAVLGFVKLVRDPSRLEEIIEFADAIEVPDVLRAMTQEFAKDPRGAAALVARPRVGRLDLDELRALPEGSFGRAIAEHCMKNGIDPAAIPALPVCDDASFMRAHLFETHDIWHTVTGFGTDFAGEMGLQAFYFAQFPAPLSAALFAVNFLNLMMFAMDEREQRMDAIARGWIMGRRAQKLFGVAWSSLFRMPLDEVRRQLGIDAALDGSARVTQGRRRAPVAVAHAASAHS